MSKPLLFLGSNSAIQLYVDAATQQGIQVAGILDSDYYGNTETFKNLPVVGTERELDKWRNDYDFFIATNWSPDIHHVRDTQKRAGLIRLVEDAEIRCVNLINPTVHIGSDVTLGNGVYIGFGTYIEHGCSIGNFSFMRYQVGIGHDCKVGKNTVLQGQVGLGNVNIGNNVYVGMWTKIYRTQETIIGDGAILDQALWVARNVNPGEHVKLSRDAVKIYRNATEISQ